MTEAKNPRLAEEISAGYLASEVAHELPYVLEDLKKHSEKS